MLPMPIRKLLIVCVLGGMVGVSVALLGSSRQVSGWDTFRAFKNGDAASLDYALDHGGNTGLFDIENSLYLAVIEGRTDLMTVLLKHGASVGQSKDGSSTPLGSAVAHKQYEAARLLIQNGADVDLKPPGSVGRPIDTAICNRDERMVKLLLDSNAKTDHLIFGKWTPLQYAVLQRNQNIIEDLLNSGASLNQGDRVGRTALHYAASKGNIDIASMLIRRGAEVNGLSMIFTTPLDEANLGHHLPICTLPKLTVVG
jgi:ankyrin repeat protein